MIVGVLQGLTIGPLNKLMFKAFSIVIICGASFLLVNIQLLQSSQAIQRKLTPININRRILLDENIDNVEILQPGLNHHVWEVYASSIDFLCDIPLFPKAPDSRKTTNSLELNGTQTELKYAERIFGFLSPLKSGKYKFAISSDESSELWINADRNGSQLIAYVGERGESARTERNNFTTFPSQISKVVKLKSGMTYFIEILHIARGNSSHLTVQWKEPGKTHFSPINKEFLIPYISQDFNLFNVFYDIEIPLVKSCQYSRKANKFLYEEQTIYISHSTFSSVLPSCQFDNPRERLRRQRSNINLRNYESLTEKYFKKTFVYTSKPINKNVYDYGQLSSVPWWGNVQLNEKEAKEIANLVWERIARKFKR